MSIDANHTGGGGLLRTRGGLRLVNPPLDGATYCNAQLDDYARLPRAAFAHRPPLRLTVCARFSHPSGVLGGTAGFGFWNDPFLMSGAVAGRRLPALPRALWFFYSGPPGDLRLAANTPGGGWKAAAIDAAHWGAAASLPLTALLAPALRSDRLYRRLWPRFERRFGIAERQIDAPMTERHTYTLDWQPDAAVFAVDGRVILTARLRKQSSRAPLGFVAWLDNQYLVIHPSGRLRWGLVAKPGAQWMEIDAVRVE